MLHAYTDAGRRQLPLFAFLFCVLQPVLDVLSYWMDCLGLPNTLTLLLRLVLLVCIVALGFAVSGRRRSYFLVCGALALYTLCHVLACMRKGYQDPVGDLTNLMRIYQLPLTALAFVTFLRQNERTLAAIERGFFVNLLIIAAVELLSLVTGTNPYTYPNKSIGLLGWFYFANSQSAILSMLIPVAIVYVLKKFKLHPLAALCIGLLSAVLLYFFATRLAYMALFGTTLALAASLVLLRFTKKIGALRAAGVLLGLAILAAGLYSFSPMVKNQQLVAANLVGKQAHIDELVAADDAAAAADGLSGDARTLASLRSAYEEYQPGSTARFGLERTAALYAYSTDAAVITDDRLEKVNYCKLLLQDAPLTSRLFGLELADMSYDGAIYDVENDFSGILYLCGIAGLFLLALLLAWVACRILRALICRFGDFFTLQTAGYCVALLCGLAHAYFTAGVLRRPNASFYLAVVLAVLFAGTDTAKTKETKELNA